MTAFVVAVCIALLVFGTTLWSRQAVLRREAHIRHAMLPRGLFEKLRQKHPQLTQKECQLVAHGLRQFFLAHLKSGRLYVSMPSRVADDLWHEFILHTRHYELFCRKAFGRFLHHTPAVAPSHSPRDDEGLRRCWRHACLEENINPRAPTRLPLLFALDLKLGIADGLRYVPDLNSVRREGSGDSGGSDSGCGGDAGSDLSLTTSSLADGAGSGCGGDAGSGGGGDGGSSCGGGGCGGGGGD